MFFVDRELDERARRGATAVAWILFVEGAPRQLINVSIAAARRLLNETPWLDERPVRMAPISVQERLIGTMIGRALAHEIGHYLPRVVEARRRRADEAADHAGGVREGTDAIT